MVTKSLIHLLNMFEIICVSVIGLQRWKRYRCDSQRGDEDSWINKGCNEPMIRVVHNENQWLLFFIDSKSFLTLSQGLLI